MNTILIYSIIRNREYHIDTYYKQIKQIVNSFPQYNFLLSIYENDSTDGTKEKIKSKDWSFIEHSIITEDINTEYFTSVSGSKDRVSILADARNKAIEAKDFLQRSNYVLHIEGDMIFDIKAIKTLFNFSRINPNFDIVSGMSVGHDSKRHYDTWGTRKQSTDTSYKITRQDYKLGKYGEFYATSNGIALYKSEPFKLGARHGWFNKTLGHHDCEMVVVCDEFRRLGFNNIYIVYEAQAIHNG